MKNLREALFVNMEIQLNMKNVNFEQLFIFQCIFMKHK